MFGIIDLKRILPWLLKSNKNLILIKFQDRGKQQVHRQLIGTGYLSARRWKLNSRTEQKEAMCTDTTWRKKWKKPIWTWNVNNRLWCNCTYFFFILLNADKEIIIPPYLAGDRAAAGLKDLSDKFNVTQVKGMASIKRYFHRLFPRAESSFFYCNVILASDKRPEELMDMISLRLRDNRMWLDGCFILPENKTKSG